MFETLYLIFFKKDNGECNLLSVISMSIERIIFILYVIRYYLKKENI